jgi:Major capsid protein Gp23
MSNVLEKLTEGVVERNMLAETQAIVGKWTKSGLLEGLKSERERSTMAVLLENQAKELLREATTMAGGDVQGFAAVAFPIVRRVFAGLIANDLVSVQPMSLPSGLVFFMDFKRGTNVGNVGDRVFSKDESFFGDRLGVQITGGVRLDGAQTEKGFYNLANGYDTSRYHTYVPTSSVAPYVVENVAVTALTDAQKTLLRWDPDLLSGNPFTKVSIFRIPLTAVAQSGLLAEQDVFSLSVAQAASDAGSGAGDVTGSALENSVGVVRRLTQVVTDSGVKYLQFVVGSPSASPALAAIVTGSHVALSYPIKDNLQNVGTNALGALVGATPWTLEGSADIPEVELKVDSFSITARTRKLKAQWTPELGQDLNAYHNLDAEVELTSILSEQIGLEIDQEILNDLVKGSTAGVKYWSRRPGKFVNRLTGVDAVQGGNYAAPPDFTGNVSMWYETLVETINDVSALIHRKTLRGGANFLVCSPEVANILEFTSGFRASVTNDAEKGTVGAVKVGDMNKKWDIIVHPYFLRNVILVGRKGGSFLESGYVYAPYVPLQSTPTIFDPNTFTPRKAVLTRYGKAMVRPDMYGLVIVEDLEG